MSQIIEKIAERTFKLFWEEQPQEVLTINFNPIVTQFQLIKDKCVLVHWQAKPKGLRRFGVYDVLMDKYFGVDFDKLSIGFAKSQPIQVDEKVFNTVPTAVLLYKNVSVHDVGKGSLAIY